MYIGLHVVYPLFLSDFSETNFIDRFLKNTQISLKSVQWKQVVPCGRTDMTQLIVSVHNSANAPKKKKANDLFLPRPSQLLTNFSFRPSYYEILTAYDIHSQPVFL